uniref:ABC transporter domain-containing protein n=1 Tax=Tetradesmus obliquus TaxID=3088 RepID=A0A383VPE1_TETOB|eukprot:jgi/Sobl393_1/15374/SZX67398.1
MTATAKLRHSLLDSLQQHKGLRQTTALFVKNVLVAWRNRWATAIRLLAPLLFLALALIVQVVMAANSRRTGRIRDTPFSSLSDISSIPDCSDELFIYNKPCLDFVYTPNNDTTVKAIVDAMMRNNQPPIPAERVMGFGSRFEADTFIQGRSKYVMGAVHFHQGPSGQLQYVLQTNTSAPAFKGYVQSPNEFFQMPFMSAITREISRYFLAAAGKQAEADALVWQPRLGPFPHPQLSAGTAGYILPPFIFVACMFATISHLTMLVTEKETGLRQALQTMGLQQGSYWLSWWLFEAVMAGITAWCITGFGVALRLAMFVHNDVWLMFVLFWLFGMAMASFTCCVSVFLQTSQSASNAGLGIVLVGWICQALGCYGLPFAPSIYFTKNGMGKVFFWIFAMFPWNPLTKGVLDMSAAAADATRGGLHFAERASYCVYTPDPNGGIVGNMDWLYVPENCIYPISQCYWTLVVQALAWMAVAVYMDNVQPNKHGVKLPFWYPLLPGYWSNMFRAATAAALGRRTSSAGASEGSKARNKTPFATSDMAKKVAKSITQAQQDEELVIRCSSSPGNAAVDQHKGAAAGIGVNGSVGSVHRHSVSSGFLRRRDHRASAGGDQATAAAAGSAAPVELGNRGQSTLGKLPQFGTTASVQNSQQLMVQNSVTVLRLSDASSETHSPLGGAVAGNTISLQQYQQMQQAKAAGTGAAASGRRWWEFWRQPESSLTLASKKHDSLVAAAAVARPGAPQGKEPPNTGYGIVPVVLDPGVLQEEQRMKTAWYSDADGAWSNKQDMVQVFGLRKVYRMPPPRNSRWWQRWLPFGQRRQRVRPSGPQQQQPQQFVAVADSWFGVPKGQLLCLLGPNGAGKTTSINCLIGALPPSGGDIRVMGHSLLAPGGLEVAQAVMGVCPQFDVLWDELSGREHMYIYGCIKGLPSKEVTEQGSRLLEQVQLTPAAGKRSSSYSGGMKRRLSVALALLGGPQLVFLDEPSTGMDPISRRAVWDAINAAKQHAAVVLTTHSMEEADALGDRIGIMVRGRMRVLGGSLTLKQKYGNGYQLRMRLKDNATLSPEGQLAGTPRSVEAALAADAGVRTANAGLQSAQSGSHNSSSNSHVTSSGTPSSSASPQWASAAALPRSPSAAAATAARFSFSSSLLTLQHVVAEHLGLTPVEEGRGMLHYVIPQALAPQLQVLLELLDMPDKQQQLGLAEVHVSLASLEEVFLTVVKQAEQDHAALHGHTVVVELPETGQQLEVPVGQEAAVDPATGDVYAVEWVQDEWGKLAVLGVRLMEQAEQQRYWQNRHVQH